MPKRFSPLWRIPSFVICSALLAGAMTAWATDRPDWLVDPSGFKAAVKVSPGEREVELNNGLIRRVIRLQPNAATVAFDNLMTGEPLLRSVRPEARVNLDYTEGNIGGLVGQPIHNYLDEAWVDQLRPDPTAYRFVGMETGPTRERFPWKKRLEWMPQDLPWPPPGVSLTLRFEAPENFGKTVPPIAPILTDNLAKEAEKWKTRLSPHDSRASLNTDAGRSEIRAFENTFAFAERSWPKGGTAVQALIDPGTDRSASWGPGLALVYQDKTVRFYLRPGRGVFGLHTGAEELEPEKLEPGKPYWLRMQAAGGDVICSASLDGQSWKIIGEFNRPGQPEAVRIGKTSREGGPADFGEPGSLGVSYVAEVSFLAEQPSSKVVGRPTVEIHYDLYDGIPLLSKWLVVSNSTDQPVRVVSFTSEILAAVEGESAVGSPGGWRLPNMHVETDYAFGGSMSAEGSSHAIHWVADRSYTSQVNYELLTPCLLECRPPQGPNLTVAPGERFESFRIFELIHDSTDRERQGLAQRRMYRTISPWVTENPVLMHVRSAEPEAVRAAMDQCAEVGFEMVIMTFGSGFDFESRKPEYQQEIKKLADYGRERGIALGGYSLLASRGAATPADNTVGKTMFGVMPCLGAKWGRDYLAQIGSFIGTAGLGVLEHDGSYPGDTCESTNHPFHSGFEDSQWVQWRAVTDLYKWCRSEGVYLNIPDWYFLNGGNKTGMGYREVNWSLPREYQEIIERQNIFDGTWEKTPSMGWMFVPLTEYHGGGAAATIEPLKDHLPHYEQRLANLFGAGVIACYRGPRLYDSDETKAVVKRWVDFYKQHRAILNSDIIHLRRANGRDLDYLLHVNPALEEKGLLMVYNPLDREVRREIRVPLYYAGVRQQARVITMEGTATVSRLDPNGEVVLPVCLPAKGVGWFVFQQHPQ